MAHTQAHINNSINLTLKAGGPVCNTAVEKPGTETGHVA
jgi:hypothetical protein